ncbi:hypothetical protein ACYOEI_25050 [Singulisphaera rosea]
MTPIRPRPQVWPFLALPTAVVFALLAVSVGFAKEDPTPPRDNPIRTNPSVPAAKEDFLAADSDRQISLQVRWVDLAEQPWRDRLKDRLKSCGDGADARGSILDREGMAEFLKIIKEDSATDVVQAPKVTTFEGAPAHINLGPEEKKKRGGAQPGVAAEPGHSRVEIKGVFSAQGTKLNVDVRDSLVQCRFNVKEVVFATEEIRYQGICGVPDDSSLLISLGHYERKVDGKTVKSERLITITPHRIIIPPAPPVEKRPDAKNSSSAPHSDRQISFKVLSIHLEEQPWRERIKRHLKPCNEGADTRGSLVDREWLGELTQVIKSRSYLKIRVAPKVTSFEQMPARFDLGETNGGDRVGTLLESQTKEFGRTQVEVKGVFLPQGTKLTVSLVDTMMPGREIEPKADGITSGEVHYESTCDIPDDSSLLISLGHYERMVDSKSVRCERLILIMPYCIRLEGEDGPLSDGSSTTKRRR